MRKAGLDSQNIKKKKDGKLYFKISLYCHTLPCFTSCYQLPPKVTRFHSPIPTVSLQLFSSPCHCYVLALFFVVFARFWDGSRASSAICANLNLYNPTQSAYFHPHLALVSLSIHLSPFYFLLYPSALNPPHVLTSSF